MCRLDLCAYHLRDPLVVCGELLRVGSAADVLPGHHTHAHSQERLLQVHGDRRGGTH